MSQGGKGGIEESFARSWQAEVLDGPPLIAPARQFQYPRQVAGEEDALARGALRVLVQPAEGGGFLANFALGFSDPRMPTGLWTCPNPRELCALAGGYGYVVDTAEPGRCELIELRPIVGVRPMPGAGLLVFVGINQLTAYGPEGVAWTTARLSWEGLRITEATGGAIRGFGWDMFTDREAEFQVDVKTGAHTGGAYRAGR